MKPRRIEGPEHPPAPTLRRLTLSDADELHSDIGRPPSETEQRTSDIEQALSDADQALSQADQRLADTDQAASAAAQVSADRDQRASDQDQASADRDLDRAAEPTVAQIEAYDTSRDERAAGTFERLESRQEREDTAQDRDATAAERDRIATARDDRGAERDKRGSERDRRGRRRDASAAEFALTKSARKASIIERLADLGANAAADRTAAAGDRARAARDRAEAGHERHALEAELHAAHMDELTGTYRREMGRVVLANEIDRAQRADGRLVLAFIDVDGLKAVNDRLGHAAGDEALQAVVEAIRTNLRSFDVVVRQGGDEFVCALGGIDLAEAQRRFGSVQAAIEAKATVGISVGMAALAPGDNVERLTGRADVAMLAVKAQHRLQHRRRAIG